MLKLGNTYLNFGGTYLTGWVDQNNPLNLPVYTIRLKYNDGITPRFTKGTATQVSQSPNIWDLTYENTNWQKLVYDSYSRTHQELIEVMGANVSGVTNMKSLFEDCRKLTKVSMFNTFALTNAEGMFYNCYVLNEVSLFDTSNVTTMYGTFMQCKELRTVPKFNTSNVTNMEGTFANCYSLTSVPLFDTSNVTTMYHTFMNTDLRSIPLFNTSNVDNMQSTFANCFNVESGALALYQQASSQANPPSNHQNTFVGCGRDTTTGSAELAQIPSDWK